MARRKHSTTKYGLEVALACLIATAPFVMAARADSALPISGAAVPELTAFDDAMTHFMESKGIQAGLLGVMKNGWVVLERGYGWNDAAHSQPLSENAMMRIASLTKPITASAIRKLAAEDAFSLDDFIFDLGQPGGGLLEITPFLALGDPRLADVTVRHCLDHRGGWDSSLVGDLTYKEIQIATEMRVTHPPGRANTASWILGEPLQHNPGDVYAYSNLGYMLLGLVIEQFSEMGYMDYVHQEVFGPLSVDLLDIELGRTFVSDLNPREPWYQYTGSCTSVFDPSTTVNCPHGGWDHEARVSQGRVIASTRPLLHFLETYYISGPDIGAQRTGTEPVTWKRNHTGSFRGTNALARQRGDGVNYVVLFNERPAFGASYSSQIRTILDHVIETEISQWPEPEPIPALSMNGLRWVQAFVAVLGIVALAKRHRREEPGFPSD
ncbi:beta-lactamase family protein [Myxococcota bacterium]|nr:beta-lactamase family protein [Myxococcota bacterium]